MRAGPVTSPSQPHLLGHTSVPSTPFQPRIVPSGIARARSESSVSSVTSARSAPSALYPSPCTARTPLSSLVPSIEGAAPSFYTAITPDGPLLPFYAAPSSTAGGPASYFTPSQGVGTSFAAPYNGEALLPEGVLSPHAETPFRTQSASPFGQAMPSYTGMTPQPTPFLSPLPALPEHSTEKRDPSPGAGGTTARMGTMRRLLGRSGSSNVK